MDKVVAKFKVNSITRMAISTYNYETKESKPAEIRSISLSPVQANGDPEHENSKFWAASPSGEIKLGCANLPAAAFFDLNKSYYVTFTEAPED